MEKRLRLLLCICGVALMIVGVTEVALYASGDVSVYSDVPRAEFSRYFYDLRIWSMNMADCQIPIGDLAGHNHCASDFYVFDYPVFPLYVLRFLGWKSSIHGYMGLILGILSVVSTIFLTLEHPLQNWTSRHRVSWIVMGAFTAVVCTRSLPLRYAIERGQIDQVVYISAIALYAYIKNGSRERGNPWILTFALLILAALSLAKIYPIASLIWITSLSLFGTWRCRNTRRIRESILGGIFLPIVLSAGCLFLLARSIAVARAANSFPVGGHGFGLTVLTDAGYANGSEFSLISKVLVTTAFCLLTFWVFSGVDSLQFYNKASHYITRSSQKSTPRSWGSYKRVKPEVILLLIVFPFLEALYISSESINYKIIFIAALVPWFYLLIDSSSRALKYFGFLQLILVWVIFLSPGLPFNPSLYLYVEWFNHFACQPAFFGCLAAQGIWISGRLILTNRDPTDA